MENTALYFNNVRIPYGECNGPVVQSRGATISNFVGVINVFLCERFTTRQEGVYTCTMRNSDMVDESVKIGLYLPGRSESYCYGGIFIIINDSICTARPVITTTLSNIDAVVRNTLTLSCTSEGSPPDTFTWMKDGVPITQSANVFTVAYNSNLTVFRSEYTIRRTATSDEGTYMCTVINPIGNDNHSIDVTITGRILLAFIKGHGYHLQYIGASYCCSIIITPYKYDCLHVCLYVLHTYCSSLNSIISSTALFY